MHAHTKQLINERMKKTVESASFLKNLAPRSPQDLVIHSHPTMCNVLHVFYLNDLGWVLWWTLSCNATRSLPND